MSEENNNADKIVRPISVLYIENDKSLSSTFAETLRKQLNIAVCEAKHCQEAEYELTEEIKRYKTRTHRFAAFIVDLMLPKDKAALDESERLEKARTDILRELVAKIDVDALSLNPDVVGLRYQLAKINSQLDEHINPDGGIELLETFRESLCKKEPLRLPVIFFTARGMAQIRERCRAVVVPEYFAWFEKPTPEIDVANKLGELLTLNAKRGAS